MPKLPMLKPARSGVAPQEANAEADGKYSIESSFAHLWQTSTTGSTYGSSIDQPVHHRHV